MAASTPALTAATGRRLVLHEHTPQRGVELTRSELDGILASPARIDVKPVGHSPGLYELLPGSHVGLLKVGDLAIEIRPKVPIQRLLFLLSFGLHNARWFREAVTSLPSDDLSEAIVEIFTVITRQALSRGVLQGYRTEEAALLGVRGRIRFEDQLRTRYGIAPPIEVRYDEFTEDIELNRLLKAAAFALSLLPHRSTRSHAALRTLGHTLQRVSLVEYSARALPAIHFDRLTAHYEPAARLAALILQGCSVSLSHGSSANVSLLFNMNSVFETFVRESLREALHLDRRSFPTPRRAPPVSLDELRRVPLEPDLTWWHHGRCVFVGDAKYKKLHHAGFVHGDLYQLLAYLTALNLREGLLIYAKGEDVPHSHIVRHAGKRLHVRTLDLGGEKAELMADIDQLATLVASLAASVARE